jgi:BlaI family penicillinase repressor
MPDGKRRAYTSILSAMQVMERKGLLAHRSAGNVHVYRPRVGRTRVLGKMLRKWVDHILGGDSSAAVQLLLSETAVSKEELAEIRRMVEAHAVKEEEGS